MREFYFKDKKSNVAYQGVVPSNDVNCDPFDYFRFLHAEIWFKNYSWMLSVKCPVPIPDQYVRQYVLDRTDELIAETLAKSEPKPELHQLLTDDSLSYKQQNKLLKGLILRGSDNLWFNKEAQELGYLLDIYHEETYPKKFNDKKMPVVFNQKDDGTMDTIGTTDVTDGEMRALLEQRKVVQARIYHKNEHWHCFYFTYKGLAGEESGIMGSKPHYHYLSDKSGIGWEELKRRIKACDMPTSKVHIVIER